MKLRWLRGAVTVFLVPLLAGLLACGGNAPPAQVAGDRGQGTGESGGAAPLLGGQAFQAAIPSEATLDEALAELSALDTPAGVEESLFSSLKSALHAALAESVGRGFIPAEDAAGLKSSPTQTIKLVSTPPTGEVNRVTDLALTDNGDGSPRETSEFFPYEFEHTCGVGRYQVNLWAYDDNYNWCDEPSKHRVQMDPPAEIFVEVIPSSHTELVDDGEAPFHDDGVWDDLGSPSIAVDVNPATGQPAVAYYAATSPNLLPPSAFFSQRDESGTWSLPSRVSYGASEPWGAYVGHQLDLMFDPILFEEGFNESALPYVAATVYAYNADIDNFVNYGINVYFGSFDGGASNWAWTAEKLVDDGSNSWLAPIRLVADSDPSRPPGASLGQVVNYMHSSQHTLMEAGFSGDNWPEFAEIESGQSFVGLSHDFKPYQGNNKSSGRGAVVYTQKVGSDFHLYYEVEETTDYSWNGPKYFVANGVSSSSFRNVALDYFGDKVGIIWTTDDGDLYFLENEGEQWNPSPPELVATGVGHYTDFDYEDLIGVRTVAYETDESQWSIYVKCRFADREWSDPILVDEQIPGVNDLSHLDMEIRDAYIYIAYSKNRDIFVHIMDFFRGNR